LLAQVVACEAARAFTMFRTSNRALMCGQAVREVTIVGRGTVDHRSAGKNRGRFKGLKPEI